MDNILVEIYLPVAGRCFDVYIPLTSRLHEVEVLLAKAFMEVSGGYFVGSPDSVLCDRESGTVLDINKSALELGMCNGSRLMLI
ncbi:methyltransferase [Cohnella fermenti]|uniref:Methyltransferase n=1 Tax=Cohnella fermenti TaxID=2565925 RepID=A0A4S4BJN7_9BACL|nr:methyltransferase [Cohnella fermenti]THF73922.1 methyltransferase [Cohnella fermenti]